MNWRGGACDRFQKDGVIFAVRHGGRALIADDMGLGKTVQVAYLHHPPCAKTCSGMKLLCLRSRAPLNTQVPHH